MALTDKKGKKRPLVIGVATETKQDDLITAQEATTAAVQSLGGTNTLIEKLLDSYIIDEGTLVSGTAASTYLVNATYLQIQEDATTGMQVQLEFIIPGGFTASNFQFIGRYEGNAAHYIDVYAYNWDTTSWDQISSGSNRIDHSTSDYIRDFDIVDAHTAMNGDVRIRLLHNTAIYNAGHELYIDHTNVSYTEGGATRLMNSDNEIINPSTKEFQVLKWLWNRSEADATYEYTLLTSIAGHIIRQETLSTGVVKNFRATETDDTTIDANWADRASKTYTYV